MGTIQSAMFAQGYRRANERTDNCKHCAQAEVDYGGAGQNYAPRLNCKIGGFMVTAFGRCDRHQEPPK